MVDYTIKVTLPVEETVQPVPGATPTTTALGSSLFMEPGVFEYNPGHRFEVTQQGLLVMKAVGYPSAYGYSPYFDAGNRIVKKSADLDVYAVIAAMCALIQHGTEDEGLTISQKLAAMKSRKLRLRCGQTVELIRSALTSLGVTTRNVHLLTADTPNNNDDGHVALEAYIGGEWRFFDVDGDSYFTDGAGKHLNIGELIDLGVANAVHVRLAPSEGSSGATDAVSRLVTATWLQSLNTDAGYIDWCTRIYQIPGILDTDGNIYYYLPTGTESRSSWVTGLQANYLVISKNDWLTRFYP